MNDISLESEARQAFGIGFDPARDGGLCRPKHFHIEV